MKKTVAIASIALGLAFAAGQVFSSTGSPTPPQGEPQVMAEKLANCIAEDDFDGLKTEMWHHCVHEEIVSPLGDQLSLPYKRLCEGLGARTKVELIESETVGSSIARYSYAEFHTRGVIVWQFEFIKPNNEWKLHAYGWGPLRLDNLQASTAAR